MDYKASKLFKLAQAVSDELSRSYTVDNPASDSRLLVLAREVWNELRRASPTAAQRIRASNVHTFMAYIGRLRKGVLWQHLPSDLKGAAASFEKEQEKAIAAEQRILELLNSSELDGIEKELKGWIEERRSIIGPRSK